MSNHTFHRLQLVFLKAVLGPVLFIIYLISVGYIFRKYGISFHCYADDTQLYLSSEPNSTLLSSSLLGCLEKIKSWFSRNFLQLSTDKTEVLVCTKSNLSKSNSFSLSVDKSRISSSTQVKSLGVVLNSTLSFEKHVINITLSAYFHLRKHQSPSSISHTKFHSYSCTCSSYLTHWLL